jgi:hypothetical protein
MGRMFPFCSHPKAGSRLADLRVVSAGAQAGTAGRESVTDDGDVQLASNHLGGTEMTVTGALQAGCVMLILATTAAI